MRQPHDEITQHVAERWCWEVARRDDVRIARRLSRTQAVDGVYRLDEGAVVDDGPSISVWCGRAWLAPGHGNKSGHQTDS